MFDGLLALGAALGNGGGATWGSITGTMSNQTDLEARFESAEDQINNLKNLGRFLAVWDCETGLPTTEPPRGVPFDYSVGDYFRVGSVGVTNYKPDGSQYTGDPSTEEETETVTIGAVYYYDGEVWALQAAGAGGTVQDVQVNGISVLRGGIANITIPEVSAPMQFKGTVGENGTVTSLPTAEASSNGYVYKVITAGTYAGQEATVGNLFICALADEEIETYQWVLVPSGGGSSGWIYPIKLGKDLRIPQAQLINKSGKNLELF